MITDAAGDDYECSRQRKWFLVAALKIEDSKDNCSFGNC